MPHDSKQGFFSSLFGRKQNEPDEAAELESKLRLDERIRQVIAEMVDLPGFGDGGTAFAPLTQKEEAEVELLPISANGLGHHEAHVPVALLPSNKEVTRSYTANQQ